MKHLLTRLLTMPYALGLPLVPIGVFCVAALLYAPANYRQPEDIPFWPLLFGLPHIISSFQTMCDREYLSAYRTRFLRMAALLLSPYSLYLIGVPASALLAVALAFTIHHLVAQQFGISLAVARMRPGIISKICKWSIILLATAAYFRQFSTPALWGEDNYFLLGTVTENMMLPMLSVIVISGVTLVVKTRAQYAGAILLAANISCFIIAFLLIFNTRHSLIGLMLMRILHDVSGFIVYMRHDTNRNNFIRRNFLYNTLPFFPAWALNIFYSVAIAAALTALANRIIFIGWLVVGITMVHYYLESFVWRGGTPHRQHLAFS